MKVTLLGTGTSTGVPLPGCQCEVCCSDNPKNKRLRCSVYIELHSRDLPGHLQIKSQEESETDLTIDETIGAILIDTSPDLRCQALTHKFSKIDAVLYTHTHADHIFGIDDLRSFNFINRKSIPVFATQENYTQLKSQFRYCFDTDPGYEGGLPPQLSLNMIKAYEPFSVCGVPILPLPVMHGSLIVTAFRIGNFAYVTDCSEIPEATKTELRGLEYLVLDGLRERPHKTHFTVAQAVEESNHLAPEMTYLTHISHELDHDTINAKLKLSGSRAVELAFDGLSLVL